MKYPIIALLLIASAVYSIASGTIPLPSFDSTQETVTPPSAGTPDLLAVFAVNPDAKEAKAHAEYTRHFFAWAKQVVEFDTLQPANKRLFNVHWQVEEARIIARGWLVFRFNYSQKYPDGNGKGFSETVGKFLSDRVGLDGDKVLTDDDRRKWVQAYSDLESACAIAAKGL